MRKSTVALISFIVWGAANAATGASIIGIHGDLKYNEEAGDLLGTEFRITESHGHYRAAVQVAEGTPGQIFTVPAAVIGNLISFTIVEGGYKESYVGRVTAAGFDGTLTVTTHRQTITKKLRLPRKRTSYWQKSN
jgi:hypothetical protein